MTFTSHELYLLCDAFQANGCISVYRMLVEEQGDETICRITNKDGIHTSYRLVEDDKWEIITDCEYDKKWCNEMFKHCIINHTKKIEEQIDLLNKKYPVSYN